MATRARTAVGVFAVLCLIGAAVLWRLTWRASDVTGDVAVRDTGRFWSYPRYSIVFPTIDASTTGQHSFDVAGLPSFPLTYCLALDGAPPRVGKLTVRIRDGKGGVMSEASDSASDWKWSRGGAISELWHPNLRDLRFSRNEKYTIEIDVEDVEESTPSQPLVPQLKGGGNELP